MIQLSAEEFAMLWQDKAYNVLTRPALEIQYNRRRSSGEQMWVILLDVDNIHNMNKKFASETSDGYSEVDAIIRIIMDNIRASDPMVVIGRHKSGDELVCLIPISGDPDKFIERLEKCFADQGMSASMAYSPAIDISYEDVTKITAITMQMNKAKRKQETRL